MSPERPSVGGRPLEEAYRFRQAGRACWIHWESFQARSLLEVPVRLRHAQHAAGGALLLLLVVPESSRFPLAPADAIFRESLLSIFACCDDVLLTLLGYTADRLSFLSAFQRAGLTGTGKPLKLFDRFETAWEAASRLAPEDVEALRVLGVGWTLRGRSSAPGTAHRSEKKEVP